MQGYITVALDKQKYVDMAINLARSIKFFDKKRSICLVHNDRVELSADCLSVFDHFVLLEEKDDFIGCMNKIRLYGVSPYDETMYIDADCLLVKNDIDRHWGRLSGNYFNMTGEKRTTGQWNHLVFENVCEKFKIPYVVQMNSGVFYFRKQNETKLFFDRLDELYRDHRDFLSNVHQGRAGQYADEPFFGTAMGEFRIEPLGGTAAEGSWMVTTWRARNVLLDPSNGISRIDKPCRFWFGVPVLPRAWVAHSPTIAHFIGLKPAGAYQKAAAFFRENVRSGQADAPALHPMAAATTVR